MEWGIRLLLSICGTLFVVILFAIIQGIIYRRKNPGQFRPPVVEDSLQVADPRAADSAIPSGASAHPVREMPVEVPADIPTASRENVA